MKEQEIIDSVMNTISVEAISLNDLCDTIDKDKLVELVKAIGDCKGNVIVSGCGTSGAAAVKIAHSLCCVERPASYLNPADAVHGALGRLQENDVFILISKGGNTKEILSMIPACISKKAKLIGVTENPESALAKHSDILIKVKVKQEPCPFNMLATASTLAVISLFDAVCIALMTYTNYSKEQFSIIHPGGEVGYRLLNKE